MEKNTPIWFQILKKYHQNDAYYNGLSIPFLIGVNSIINPNQPLLTIEEFIKQTQDEKLPSKIELIFCEAEEEYVFRIKEQSSLGIPLESNIVFGNLIVAESTLILFNIEEITNKMYNLYHHLIEEGKFSYSSGNWSGYNQFEKETIQNLNLL